MSSESFWDYLKNMHVTALIGGQFIASFGESGILHAFDLMSTRLQFRGDYLLKSLGKEARRVHADGGIRSFYRGYGFAAAANVPIELIYRTTYDYNCRTMKRSAFLSGVLADTIVSIFQVPTEVVTQRLQIAPRGTSAMHVIRSLWSEQGLRGFYRTINIALLFHPFQAGCWWYSYELSRANTANNVLISATVASIFVATLLNPITVVKTQIQTGRSTLSGFQLLRNLLTTPQGRQTLAFAGLAPTMVRSVLEGFIHAYTYETIFKIART
jgi:hypothetical protein